MDARVTRPAPSGLLALILVLVAGCVPPEFAEDSDTGGTGSSGASDGTDGEPARPSVMTTTADPEPGSEALAECSPGASQLCPYAGPPGTAMVGSCHPGTRVCDAEGRWGDCAGEVVPSVEDCRTAADENCDGQSACTGDVEWARSFGEPLGGEPGPADVHAAAVDGQDRLWLAGSFFTEVQFGAMSWQNLGDRSAYYVRIDAAGTPEFSYADVRPDTNAYATSLAIDRGGNVAVGVWAETSLQIAAGAPVRTTGDLLTFSGIGLLDADGGYRADIGMTTLELGSLYARDLAYDGAGDLWVVGHFSGAHAKLGADPDATLVENHGKSDAFLVKLAPDGALLLARSFGDGQDQEALGVDVDAEGDVWLVGRHTGNLQFPGGTLHAATNDPSQFIVKLDGEARWKWGFSYSGAGEQRFSHVRVDGDGGATVAGTFSAPSLGIGGFHLSKGLGDAAVVLARYDAHGNVRAAQSWPCVGYCNVHSLAIDGAGQVVTAIYLGWNSGLMIAGEQHSSDLHANAAVLVKLDAEGALLWQPRVLDADMELAVGPTGSIYISGEYDSELTLGDGPALQLDAGGDDVDIYVARLRP